MSTPKKTAKKKSAAKKTAKKTRNMTNGEIDALKAKLVETVAPAPAEPTPSWVPDPDDDYVPEGCEPLGEKPRVHIVEDEPTPAMEAPAVAAIEHFRGKPVVIHEVKEAPEPDTQVASLEHFVETLFLADDAIKFLTKKARLLMPKDRRILADRRNRIQNTHAQLKAQLHARLQQSQSTQPIEGASGEG